MAGVASAQTRTPSARKAGPPKRLIAATMPPPPPQSVGREGTKRITKAGRKRQRTQASADASDSGDESEEDPLASLAKKLQNKKPKKAATASQADDGEISEEELTETEEEIEDALINTMEKMIGAWGDEAVDGYVVWARPDGFPWWPAQMITLVGLFPGTMKQLVARWKPDYAETHCLCMFLGEKPDFAWVHRSKVKHFERGNPTPLSQLFLGRFSPVLRRVFVVLSVRVPGAKTERTGEKWWKMGENGRAHGVKGMCSQHVTSACRARKTRSSAAFSRRSRLRTASTQTRAT